MQRRREMCSVGEKSVSVEGLYFSATVENYISETISHGILDFFSREIAGKPYGISFP